MFQKTGNDQNMSEEETLDLFEIQPLLCRICLKVFPNQYYYMTHNRTHLAVSLSQTEVSDFKNLHKNIVQETNNQNTSEEKTLDLWESTDLFEIKPILCRICLKMFANQYYYVTHNKTHLEISLSRAEVSDYFNRDQTKPLKAKASTKIIEKHKKLEAKKESTQRLKEEKGLSHPGKPFCEEIVFKPPFTIRQYAPKRKRDSIKAPNTYIERKYDNLENNEQKPDKNKNKVPNDFIKTISEEMCDSKETKHQQNSFESKLFEPIGEGINSYKCKSCSKVFHKYHSYFAHTKSKICESIICCDICNTVWESKRKLKNHMKTHLICIYCNRLFKLARSLKLHILNKHLNKSIGQNGKLNSTNKKLKINVTDVRGNCNEMNQPDVVYTRPLNRFQFKVVSNENTRKGNIQERTDSCWLKEPISGGLCTLDIKEELDIETMEFETDIIVPDIFIKEE